MKEEDFDYLEEKTELWNITDLHIGKIIEIGYEEHEKNFPSLAMLPKSVVAPMLLTYLNPHNKPEEFEQTLRLAVPLDLLKRVRDRIQYLLDEHNSE